MNTLDYQALLQQMPESAIFADTQGIIRFWNAASEQLFGFTADEALGQSLDMIIPEHLRVAHWRGFQAAIENGQTKHLGRAMRTKALHRDGSFVYAQVAFCLIKDPKGKILGSLATARPSE